MRPDMTGALDAFDEMVEALEENEDMVECKECFDLFPKTDCEKSKVGYICPVCRGLRTAPAKAEFVDPYDCYTQEFPDVMDYNPDSVVEYDKEPDLGDALADLIKDEYEAIDGYEVADEKIQHAAIDADQKDEILDTLDHIKEEEEEHIDELKELCPECDSEEPEESEAEEPEKLEEAADDEVADEADSAVREKLDIDLSNCIESSDMEIWGVEPVGEGTYKAVLLKRFENVSFRGNDEIDKVESEMFDLGGLFVFYFGKDGMPELDRWDPELLRSLGNCEIIFDDERYDRACEETLNRSTSQAEELEEAANEEEVEEIPEEDIPEEETEDKAEDSEENENEEVSDLDSAYEAALEIANESGVGQVFGYARKDTEEFVAIEPFEVDDPEAVEDDLMAVYDDVAYAYVAYPEKNLEEALFESVQLTEAPHPFLHKRLDNLFKNGYFIVPSGSEAARKDTTIGIKGRKAKSYADAVKAATAASKKYAGSKMHIVPVKLDQEPEDPEVKRLLTPKNNPDLAKYGYNPVASFAAGKAASDQNQAANLAKLVKQIEKQDKKMKKALGVESDKKASAAAATDSEVEVPEEEEATPAEETSTPEEETPTPATEEETPTEENPAAADTDTTAEEKPEETPEEKPDATEPTQTPAQEKQIKKQKIYDAHKKVGDALRKANVPEDTINKLFAKEGEASLISIIRRALLGESLLAEEWNEAFEEDVSSTADPAEPESKNKPQVINEEYHRYANPAELAAMEKIELMITNAMSHVYSDLAAWGYTAEEVDSQSWLCSNNENCIQYMVHFENLDLDETEDLATQLQNTLENEAKNYKCPAEIQGIDVSVALPDHDLEDEDDAAQGITRASFLFYVTFARNLI